MPRSVQAFKQNAAITNSPANTGSGDPSSTIDDGNQLFQLPPWLDVCAPVTNGSNNPFMAGLNTMGNGANTSGVSGQTGNMLSGSQTFVDSLCGYALGGTSTSDVLAAARRLRQEGHDLHEVLDHIRDSDVYQRLRSTVGSGSTPQSILAGVQSVTNITNHNRAVQGAIAKGQTAVGVSGNQIIDSINGAQVHANETQLLLTGYTPTQDASGDDIYTAAGVAINQNTAQHTSHVATTSAQSVNLINQNLLVADDFSTAFTIVGDTHWAWDGTDNAPGSVTGCVKVTCDGNQNPLVSSEIPVVADETIEVAVEVKWSGLAYTGASPINLAVEKYRLMSNNTTGAKVYESVGWWNVYTVPTPPASSSSVSGTTNGWLGIAGTYVVEPGVDQLRFRFEVAKNATAGTVKWDAANFLKLDLIPDGAVPGVGNTVDSIVTKLYGTAGSGFSQNQAALALANTAASLTSVTAQVAALQAEGSTGSIAGDDFNYTGTLPTGSWGGAIFAGESGRTAAPGFYSATGTAAVFTPAAGQGDEQGVFIWQGTGSTSTTDYQIVRLVLGSAPTTLRSGPFNSESFKAYIGLLGRMNSTHTQYVRARFGSDGTWTLGYQTPTGFVSMTSGTCTVPGAGTVITLYCGDKPSSTLYNYKLEIGSTLLVNYGDTTGLSPTGTTQRGWGWGFYADARGWGEGQCPTLNSWLAQDQ